MIARTHLAVLGDQPTTNPGLGFESYAAALVDAIEGGHPAQYTLGLYGPWGSGKSSLLAALATGLASDKRNVVVQFDAWRYQPGGELVASLLALISKSLEKDQRFQHFGAAIGKLALAMTSATSVSFGVDTKVSFDGAAFVEGVKTKKASPLGFVEAVQQMRDAAASVAKSRIVVLIDDLDRCSPSNLVAVLETINNVMDLPGFIFVVALDYDVLVEAISYQYPHVSGHEFIEKMVQIPFRVPPLDTSAANVLRDLLPNWNSLVSRTDEHFPSTLLTVVRRALRGNPRQAKRLVNSYLVLDRILIAQKSSADRNLLLVILGLQFGWPDEYRRLQRAVTIGSVKKVGDLVELFPEDGDESSAGSYLSAVLLDRLSVASLAEVIHLAASTAPSSYQEERALLVNDLQGLLESYDWQEKEDGYWYPSTRVEQSHTVRIAVRGGRAAVEMRENATVTRGNSRRTKSVFQTVTHVPLSELAALESLVGRLSTSSGLTSWRSEQLAKRGTGGNATR